VVHLNQDESGEKNTAVRLNKESYYQQLTGIQYSRPPVTLTSILLEDIKLARS